MSATRKRRESTRTTDRGPGNHDEQESVQGSQGAIGIDKSGHDRAIVEASPGGTSSAPLAAASSQCLAQSSPTTRARSPTSSESGTPVSQCGSTWGRVVDAFFDASTPNGHTRLDKASITYLGENFPMAILLDQFQDCGKFRLHHQIPSPTLASSKHCSHLSSEDVAFLEAKGVFERPSKDVLDAFLSVFLDTVYPYYPIVIREDFLTAWRAGETPYLLLHAVCFISATYCSPHILHAAGFKGREDARTYYHRKTAWAFNLGLEKCRIVVLQSAILLTYRLGEPDGPNNYYSWLSTAVTIAELLGIHRSTVSLTIEPKDKALMKRLWWVLVIRDIYSAVCWGRTTRIDLTQCDAELINQEDFVDDYDREDEEMQRLMAGVVEYQVQMCQYALLLGETVRRRVTLSETSADAFLERVRLERRLEDFRSSLRLCSDRGAVWPCLTTKRLATALSIFYDHLRIVLHLRKSTLQDTSHQMEPQLIPVDGSFRDPGSYSRSVLAQASQNITSMASSLTTQELICTMPHESFVGVFSAEVALAGQLMTSRHTASSIAAKAQISVCQMVMHNIRDFWESATSVIKLFDQVLARWPLPASKQFNVAFEQDASHQARDYGPAVESVKVPEWRTASESLSQLDSSQIEPMVLPSEQSGEPGSASIPANANTISMRALGDEASGLRFQPSLDDYWNPPAHELFPDNWFAHDIISQVFEQDGSDLDWMSTAP